MAECRETTGNSHPTPPRRQREAIDAFYEGPGLLPLLRSATTQLLLVNGAHDKVIPPASQTALAAVVPAASLLQVPDAGHVSGCAQSAQQRQAGLGHELALSRAGPDLSLLVSPSPSPFTATCWAAGALSAPA